MEADPHPARVHTGQLSPSEPIKGQLEFVSLAGRPGFPVNNQVAIWIIVLCIDRIDPPPDHLTLEDQ